MKQHEPPSWRGCTLFTPAEANEIDKLRRRYRRESRRTGTVPPQGITAPTTPPGMQHIELTANEYLQFCLFGVLPARYNPNQPGNDKKKEP